LGYAPDLDWQSSILVMLLATSLSPSAWQSKKNKSRSPTNRIPDYRRGMLIVWKRCVLHDLNVAIITYTLLSNNHSWKTQLQEDYRSAIYGFSGNLGT
jgi:hypothetical protein